MTTKNWTTALAATTLLSLSGLAWGVDDPPPRNTAARPQADTPSEGRAYATTYRANKLIGMNVENATGEKLGKIEDLVIDLKTGKVRYAALSFGGFLGIGDKLFAVPMQAMHMNHRDDDTYFVLNVDKRRLEKAPGFPSDAWPNFANPKWGADVDQFYGFSEDTADAQNSHSGKVVRVNSDSLVIMDNGDKQHTHHIGKDARITVDGKKADLNDVKAGHHATIHMEEREGENVVTVVAVKSDSTRTTK